MYKSISDYVYFLSPEFRKSLELNSAFQIKKRGNNKLCTLLGSECTGGKDKVYTQKLGKQLIFELIYQKLVHSFGFHLLLSAEAERLLSTGIRLRDRGEKQEEDGSSYKK